MSRKNILFLSSWYPTEVHETNGNFVQRHAEAIQTDNNVFVIHAISDERQKKDHRIDDKTVNGIRTIIIYYPKIQSEGMITGSFIKMKQYTYYHNLALEILLKEGVDFDLCHCNVTFPAGLFALEIRKKLNIPLVISEHWTGFLPYRNLYKKENFIVRRLYRKIIKKASFTIPVTHDLQKAMRINGLEGNYKVIGNVVDTELFKPNSNNNEKCHFIHISTLKDDHKNISGIIRTVKKLQDKNLDFDFSIVGDGETSPHTTYAREIGVSFKNFSIEGEKTIEEIAEILKRSNCLLLFSNWENLPCVIVEAMATAIPVISTNVGGISEHISKEYGQLIEPKDEDALLGACEQMIKNYKSYDSNRIRQYALENFSKQSISSKFNSVYEEIL